MSKFVTTMMSIVIGLTFLFGFGNVLALALRIGVPAYVAPLVAPALDLTVLGLLVGTRYLAMRGAPEVVLRPARRLLLAASAATLALNVADPICAGQWGKAGFDAVGPLLLIGWAEVGPALLRSLQIVDTAQGQREDHDSSASDPAAEPECAVLVDPEPTIETTAAGNEAKLERARSLNREHWGRYQRPISAESLRRELGVGAATSRKLCAAVRSEMQMATAAAPPG
ncbi:hypothetical protein [Amycolatopsis sp. SID8362]|uniref:hypothetical protein n=1 Tax=Amycolatopsis sp. SID8362 TaxID=2690346 RepID=UPI00136CAF31|nr:hypothetical protein [Amycolatopsis sp. SID8362]NBH06735.1 hypothetical protein [Amycolatopsis sp. SID8362]NED43432.1 hypothetical protein [Amycolatopsis sp. SID8362]